MENILNFVRVIFVGLACFILFSWYTEYKNRPSKPIIIVKEVESEELPPIKPDNNLDYSWVLDELNLYRTSKPWIKVDENYILAGLHNREWRAKYTIEMPPAHKNKFGLMFGVSFYDDPSVLVGGFYHRNILNKFFVGGQTLIGGGELQITAVGGMKW